MLIIFLMTPFNKVRAIAVPKLLWQMGYYISDYCWAATHAGFTKYLRQYKQNISWLSEGFLKSYHWRIHGPRKINIPCIWNSHDGRNFLNRRVLPLQLSIYWICFHSAVMEKTQLFKKLCLSWLFWVHFTFL